jgi:hypothetical protein
MDWMYIVCFIAGVVWYKAFFAVFSKRQRNAKEGTPSASHNSVRDASCCCQPPFYINNVTFSSLYRFCPWCGRNLHP